MLVLREDSGVVTWSQSHPFTPPKVWPPFLRRLLSVMSGAALQPFSSLQPQQSHVTVAAANGGGASSPSSLSAPPPTPSSSSPAAAKTAADQRELRRRSSTFSSSTHGAGARHGGAPLTAHRAPTLSSLFCLDVSSVLPAPPLRSSGRSSFKHRGRGGGGGGGSGGGGRRCFRIRMADREASPIPLEIRARLAELELELSEGKSLLLLLLLLLSHPVFFPPYLITITIILTITFRYY